MEKVLVAFILIFILVSTLAGGNTMLVEYFTDNFLVNLLVAGGYYSLALIAAIIIAAIANEKFRKILVSVLIAGFGVALLMFFFEAIENFELIPD
jgi:hypothetical protein